MLNKVVSENKESIDNLHNKLREVSDQNKNLIDSMIDGVE